VLSTAAGVQLGLTAGTGEGCSGAAGLVGAVLVAAVLVAAVLVAAVLGASPML